MNKVSLFFCILLLTSSSLFAEPIIVGKAIPEVEVPTRRGGEIFNNDGQIEYKNWNSKNLTGKVRIIYHLAARMGIDKINQSAMDELDTLKLDNSKFVVLTIINSDDVFMGADGFAKKEVEKNRLIHKDPEFVLDNKSNIQHAWDLKRKSSTIIVVDENNQVLFFKDGKLNDQEKNNFLSVLKDKQKQFNSEEIPQ